MKREYRKNRAKSMLKIGQLGFWGGSHPSQTPPPSFRWGDLYCSLATEEPGTWISKAPPSHSTPKAASPSAPGTAVSPGPGSPASQESAPGRGVPPCRDLPRGRRAEGSEATRVIRSGDTATHRSLLSRLPKRLSTRVTFPVRKVKAGSDRVELRGMPEEGRVGTTSWEGSRDTPPPPPVRSQRR